METKGSKHENYEILNLIGYGLSKFDNAFIEEFGFNLIFANIVNK